MTFSAAEPSRLDVGRAVSDGWQAFARSPWPFVGFTVVLVALSVIFQGLQGLASPAEERMPTLPDLLLALIGSIGSLVTSLWGTVGLVRGAWQSLEGRAPAFSTFTRWNGPAMVRLLMRQLVLGVAFLLLLLIGGLATYGASLLSTVVAIGPALVTLGVFLYLTITQKFLAQMALAETLDPIATVKRGIEVVNPQWWLVLLLALVEVLVIFVGLLACGVGLFVAAPVVICISTAAYRQLFGTTDLTGLLSD